MLNCFLAGAAFVCMSTNPGVKKVECVTITEKNICVDISLDTGCYQDTLEQLRWEDTVDKKIVDKLNVECGEKTVSKIK